MVTESDMYALEQKVQRLEEKFDNLIDKFKEMLPPDKIKNEESLCDSCANSLTNCRRYSPVKYHCDHYEKESKVDAKEDLEIANWHRQFIEKFLLHRGLYFY